MKEFNLEAAKNGAKLCTRDGRAARIVCFDCENDEYPIVGLIKNGEYEFPETFTLNGKFASYSQESDFDLMMLENTDEIGKTDVNEIYKNYEFKPFEQVLVRDSETDSWHCSLYSHKYSELYNETCDGCTWRYCIPYNEDTKHLLGTSSDEI